LPATEAEIDTIVGVFQRTLGGRAEIVNGSKATKDMVGRALSGHRYLHLATHGYFAPPSIKPTTSLDPMSASSDAAGQLGRASIEGFYPGLLSGLAWAGVNAPPIDPATGILDQAAGTMTAAEVGSLDLSGCELAVLSACETGLGQTAGGEGVLSLQRAFHQAGCRTVIASLWKVDDAATAALMTRFYEHLWGEKLTPIESLRRAQLDMLEGRLPAGGNARGIGAPQAADPKASRVGQRIHPRFWAAWTLSGTPTTGAAGAAR
jgi:CHAT domain-containing protein